MQSLAIPLTDNPTRQKIWRVVVFVAPLAFSALVAGLIFRVCLVADTLSSFAPSTTDLSVRILKTPTTADVLENEFHGTLLFPNAPFTLNEVSDWSRRGSELFMSPTGIIGVAVAGKIPSERLQEARDLGLIVEQRLGGTFVGTEKPSSTKFRPRLSLRTVWPWFNGEIIGSNGSKAPLRLTDRSITVSGLGRPRSQNELNSANQLANISISAKEAEEYFGYDVPLVFPGLRSLESEILKHGLSFSLGKDKEGVAYSVAVTDSDLTREDLENIVGELFYTNSLARVLTTDVHASVDEIVANSTATPVTTNDPSATISTISDNSGALVRATQSAHSLIITNRSAIIDQTSKKLDRLDTCLPRATQWIAFADILDLLPKRLSTPDWTIFQKLQETKAISFSKNKTRVCW